MIIKVPGTEPWAEIVLVVKLDPVYCVVVTYLAGLWITIVPGTVALGGMVVTVVALDPTNW